MKEFFKLILTILYLPLLLMILLTSFIFAAHEAFWHSKER